MAFNKKYAGLPDLDPSPDLYETPDLADETSTLPATTVRTPSESEDDPSSNSDIDRRGINAQQARSHFLGVGVDAREANFSDSIATKRKAYRTKTYRRYKRDAGIDDTSEVSDEERESIERKLARLRREIEELKDELATPQSGADSSSKTSTDGRKKLGDDVEELSHAVDNLHVSWSTDRPYSAASVLAQKLAMSSSIGAGCDAAAAATAVESSPAETENQAPVPSGLLSHAASFDARLALIEAAMGITSSSNPFIPNSSSEPALQPVLPALQHLTSRLSTLTSILIGPTPASAVSASTGLSPATATTPHLEALAARVRKLITDADALASARKRAVDNAKAALAARIRSTADGSLGMEISDPAPGEADPTTTQHDEQASKIQALYAMLPTIQSLHPLLPSVLERLRSLRAIHAGAAEAVESLDELERRQAEMKRDIGQWLNGLKIVEEKVNQGETAMKNNIETVEPWVRDLEKRLDGLLKGESR